MIDATSLDQVIAVCRRAVDRGDPGALSTGERLVAALVLNRPDWLADAGYTIVDALERIGAACRVCLGPAAKAIELDAAAQAIVRDGLQRAAVRREARSAEGESIEVAFAANLITYGSAPGYRDVSLLLGLHEIGAQSPPFRAAICIRPQDAESIVRHVLNVHRFAWSDERGPLDRREDEERPPWIGPPERHPLSG